MRFGEKRNFIKVDSMSICLSITPNLLGNKIWRGYVVCESLYMQRMGLSCVGFKGGSHTWGKGRVILHIGYQMKGLESNVTTDIEEKYN